MHKVISVNKTMINRAGGKAFHHTSHAICVMQRLDFLLTPNPSNRTGTATFALLARLRTCFNVFYVLCIVQCLSRKEHYMTDCLRNVVFIGWNVTCNMYTTMRFAYFPVMTS